MNYKSSALALVRELMSREGGVREGYPWANLAVLSGPLGYRLIVRSVGGRDYYELCRPGTWKDVYMALVAATEKANAA